MPSKAIFCAILGLVAVGTGIMCIFFPYAFDDFMFLRSLGISADGMASPFDWTNLKIAIKWRYEYDTIRLANFSAWIACLLPKWVSGLLSGAAFSAGIYCFARAIGLSPRQWAPLALLAATTTAMPSWSDTIVVMSYQYNYMWSMALGAAVIWLFLKGHYLPVGAAFAIGMVMGWWHEGFSMPLIAGFVAVMILNSPLRSRWRMWLVGGLVVGAAIIAAAPGISARIVREDSANISLQRLHDDMESFIPLGLFIVLSVIALCRKSLRGGLLHDTAWQTLMLTALASAAMSLLLGGVRSGIFGQCVSCAGIVLTLRFLFPTVPGWLRRAAGTACIALLTAHLAVADCLTFDERARDRALVQAQNSSPGCIIYRDINSFNRVPAIALCRPFFTIMLWQAHDGFYRLPAGWDTTRMLPPVLKNFMPGIPWRLTPNGYWEHDGYFVGAADPSQGTLATGWIETPLGRFTMLFLVTDFTGADGKPYRLLMPQSGSPWKRPVNDILITGKY